MITGVIKLTLHAPWVHSLKEKRMVVKSICGKAASKFNISISEVEGNDLLQTIVIGAAHVSNDGARCGAVLDNVIRFIEGNTEAEVVDIEREMR